MGCVKTKMRRMSECQAIADRDIDQAVLAADQDG
jgi:hypothetical protein